MRRILVLILFALCPFVGQAQAIDIKAQDEQGAIAFVNRFWSEWSSPNAIALPYIGSVVGNPVSFYGKTISREEYMKQEVALARRWPQRQILIPPGSETADCDELKHACTVSGDFAWSYSSSIRRAVSTGTANYSFTLSERQMGNAIIYALAGQSGSVISRKVLEAKQSFVSPLGESANVSKPTSDDVSIHDLYFVSGAARPWNWDTFDLNTKYEFGVNNGSDPTVVTLSSLNAHVGDTLIIRYALGQVSIGPDFPLTDANGAPDPDLSFGGNGSTGRPFPSEFMSHYPIQAGALVGDFTDDSGQLVEPPFAIGDGPTAKVIPPRATQLQMGINDDYMSDNTGSIIVSVKLEQAPQ